MREDTIRCDEIEVKSVKTRTINMYTRGESSGIRVVFFWGGLTALKGFLGAVWWHLRWRHL